MKKNLLIILFSIVIFSCKKESQIQSYNAPYEYSGALGDIVSIERKDSITPDEIRNLLPSQFASILELKHKVYEYYITYKSLNKDDDTVLASGLVFIPLIDSFAVPLTSYQHGTALAKNEVPSFGRGGEYVLNAALASGDGVVACVPDYLGLGVGEGLHLYLNPREEANSVRDILRAARKLVKQTSIVQLNEQVFLFGYSQGGHATMSAQRQLELENREEFKLTASAPMAGPYALSRTSQFDVMLDSVFYPNPFYLPYLAVSLFNTFPVYSSYSAIFKSPYDQRIPAVINGYNSSGYANSQFPYYISSIVIDSVREAIRNDPYHPIRIAAKGFDLVDDWTPTTPMKLYHCTGDDNVFYSNSVYADSVFRSKGANCELVDMGTQNHQDCAPSALFVVKTWFTGLFAPIRIK